jgi:transcriptional regulator with XRE-family HTH domain
MATKEELVNRKIGKTIAAKRSTAGYTQEEVAEYLEIGNEAFSRIERGLVSSGIYKLYQLADLFKCDVESFLIEGSRRPTDQTEKIEKMLSKISETDREAILSVLEILTKQMAYKNKKNERSDDKPKSYK